MDQREIVIDESELGDLNALAAKLFSSEHDPRSIGYKRILIRPTIQWGRIGCCLLCAVGACLAVLFGCRALGAELWLALTASLLTLAGIATVWAKKIIITLVQIYQRWAPDGIRNKCRYEPSCSQYMIQAVNKYGVIRGVSKGIDRLRRCNIDHGGFDEP